MAVNWTGFFQFFGKKCPKFLDLCGRCSHCHDNRCLLDTIYWKVSVGFIKTIRRSKGIFAFNILIASSWIFFWWVDTEHLFIRQVKQISWRHLPCRYLTLMLWQWLWSIHFKGCNQIDFFSSATRRRRGINIPLSLLAPVWKSLI